MKIKFDNLVPNNYNPRKLFRGASMEELKHSIAQHGLIEPLVVRSLGDSKYEVVCGMRRYHALKELHVEEVECNVKDLDDTQAIDVAFMENLQREDLTPIEEAKMYLTRLKMIPELKKKGSNLSLSENSKHIKMLSNLYSTSESTIRNRISLLSLPDELQNSVEIEELPLTIAYEISRLRQIEDHEIAQTEMKSFYEDFKVERDSISLNEINKRISKKIDYYKNKADEQNELREQQINELKKKIEETTKSKTQIIEKTRDHLDTYYKKFGNIETNPEFDNITDEGASILSILEKEREKYSNNEVYEDIVNNIDTLEGNISDIHLLLERVKKNNIRTCPYCLAGIDLNAIRRKNEMYEDELKSLKAQRKEIAGIEGTIDKLVREIKRDLTGIESKDEHLEKFTRDLEVLESGN
ncbi:MAG: ParB/RepB/Spo0J family partition protein [Promethearchaeota archaeon]